MVGSTTLSLLYQRASIHAFTDNPISQLQREAVLRAATRAPSGYSMMPFSIIDIQEKQTIEKLSVLCNNQKFIAHAPWILVFVVDYCKWIDLFNHVGCFDNCQDEEKDRITNPNMAELMQSVQDTMLAAGNAVIAAEAVGLGSCFIGGILDNYQEIRDLLNLPEHTIPLSMMVLGEPKDKVAQKPHPVSNLVMHEQYHRATPEMLVAQTSELGAMFCPTSPDSGKRVRELYKKRHISDSCLDRNDSVSEWMRNWCKK